MISGLSSTHPKKVDDIFSILAGIKLYFFGRPVQAVLVFNVGKTPLTRLSIPSDNHMDIEDTDHTSPTKRQRTTNTHVTPNRYPITAAAVGSKRTRETDQ